jgi:hypothetical protein
MRSFLINKNLSLYYWLKKRIGKERAYRAASAIEKVILIFGRAQVGGNRERRLMNFTGLTQKGDTR